MNAAAIGVFVVAALLSARVEADLLVTATARAKVSALSDVRPDEKTFEGPLVIGQLRELTAEANGSENSQCQPYGRKSKSQGAVSVAVFQRTDSVEIQLGSTATTEGGHFRMCTACIAGQCVGSYGRDTGAYSSADVEAEVVLQLPPGPDERNYWLSTKHALRGSGASRTLELVGEKGELMPLGSSDRRLVLAGPGKPIVLRAKLSGSSRDSGGCCRDSQQGTFFAAIALEPAPLPVPESTGRPSEQGYTSVGVLFEVGSKGEPSPVCAATLVGRRTALTAAHCVLAFGRDGRAGRLFFVSGKEVGRELGRAIPVTNVAVPSDAFPGGFSYRLRGATPKEREDDIALVYLEQEVGQPVLPLHSGFPTIKDFPSATVVSFTLPREKTSQSAVGLLRTSSSARLVSTGLRTVEYQSDASCEAIGGSPMLQVGSAGTSVVALVGETTTKCGPIETASRIEAYLPWLRERIR